MSNLTANGLVECPGCGKPFPSECDWCSEDQPRPKLAPLLEEAISIVNDYYWVASKRDGLRADERAGTFLKKVGRI